MKILYLHQYFNTLKSPSGTRTYEMARRFAAQGHEVHVVTSWRSESAHKNWFESVEDGIRVHWLPVPYSNDMSYGGRIRAFCHFALAAGPYARRIGGDVVFASSTPLTIALPGVYAAKRLGVPMVFEVRDLWPELPIAIGALRNPLAKRLAKWLELFAYRNADRVVALSPGMRDGVTKTGYPAERVHVVPNSCDIGLFRSPTVSPDRFLDKHAALKGKRLVTYAGTLGAINGVGYLVDIAEVLKPVAPAIHFLIVGSGKEEAKIRKRAARAGVLDKNVTIMPRVSKAEMPDLLSATTLAVSVVVDYPELWHNSANKFFDALAAGKPVMINHEGWQADLLRAHGAGIVVPPNDATEAAAQIHAFVQDAEATRRAGLAAAKLADTTFDRDLLAAKLLSVLEMTVTGEEMS